VQAEDRLRPRIGQHAFLDHERRPTLFSRRRPLFGGLKDELHRAGEIRFDGVQYGGDAKLHGGVHVVTARVHDADLLPEVSGAHFRRERQIRPFSHRQRVHVGADGDDRSGLAALEQRDHAGVRDAGLHFQPEFAKVVRDERRGFHFAVRELGILMELVPDLGHGGCHLRRLLHHTRRQVLRGNGRRRDQG
jgi:hypothetical protein